MTEPQIVSDMRKRTAQSREIEAIIEEREFQRRNWTDEQDRKRPVTDWVALLAVYLGKVGQEAPLYQGPNFSLGKFRRRVVQVAAICLAILEALDAPQEKKDERREQG